MHQTGHRSLATLRRYICQGHLFRAAAAGKRDSDGPTPGAKIGEKAAEALSANARTFLRHSVFSVLPAWLEKAHPEIDVGRQEPERGRTVPEWSVDGAV